MRPHGTILGAVTILVGVVLLAGIEDMSGKDADGKVLGADTPMDNVSTLKATAYADFEIQAKQRPTNDALDEAMVAYIESLSPRSFEYFRTDTVTYVEIIAPEIGVVNISELFLKNVSYLKDFLLEHSEMTGAFDGIELDIIELRKNADRFTIIYRQRIHGILVRQKSNVQLHSSGEVYRLNSFVVNPDKIDSGPTIRRDEAITHAKYALAVELGRVQSEALISPISENEKSVPPPTVYYVVEDSDESPIPYWYIVITPSGGGASYSAMVNAVTGEAKVRSAMIVR